MYSKSSTRDPDCRYPPLSRIIEGDTDGWNEVHSAGVHTYPNLARRPLQSSCFFVEMCGHRRNRTETSRISNLAGANRKVNRGYSIPVARLPDVDLYLRFLMGKTSGCSFLSCFWGPLLIFRVLVRIDLPGPIVYCFMVWFFHVYVLSCLGGLVSESLDGLPGRFFQRFNGSVVMSLPLVLEELG